MADEDKTMSDAPPTDAPARVQEPSNTAEVHDSIEVEPAVRVDDVDNQDVDAAGEDSDAAGEEDQDDAGGNGRPVSNALYKALKAITENLSEFKIKKGNE